MVIGRASRVALALAVVAFAAHRALVPMAETDLFFHLKLGQLILQSHAIPFRNLFSFTYPDFPDPDLAWGFQVLVALLYRAGGFPAIVVGKCALFVGAVVMVHRAALRSGSTALATAAATALAIAACDQRLVERPHLVTFVGLGALLLLIAESERGHPRWIYAAPLLTLVWANFHAGVFLGPLTLLLHAVGLSVDRRRWPLLGLPPARPVLAVAGVAALTTFATPAGTRLPSYLIWHTGLGATRVIEEFRHAEPFSDPWFFLLGGACALAILVGERSLRRILPVAVMALLAWRSVRFAAEWSLLAAPLAAAGGTRIGRALPEGFRSRSAATALRCTATLALALLILVERAPGISGRRFDLGLARDVVPFEAIDFVTKNGLRAHLYSDLDVGCYLLWEGWPRYRVFQDARLPAYPDEFHRALDGTSLAPASFDALLRRYGVDAALLGEPGINMRSGSFDPEEWALVFRSQEAVVYARRTAEFAPLIARAEIPLRVGFDFEHGARTSPLHDPPARSPVARCAWQARLAAALDGEGDPERALDARARALEFHCIPPSEEADARFLLGARMQRQGQLRLAIAQYDRVLALRPDHAAALANRGYARSLDDPVAATADLRAALALDPARDDVRATIEKLLLARGKAPKGR